MVRPIPDDGGAYVELYNSQLDELAKDGRGTWFTAPWLYAEYVSVYTRIHRMLTFDTDATCTDWLGHGSP